MQSTSKPIILADDTQIVEFIPRETSVEIVSRNSSCSRYGQNWGVRFVLSLDEARLEYRRLLEQGCQPW